MPGVIEEVLPPQKYFEEDAGNKKTLEQVILGVSCLIVSDWHGTPAEHLISVFRSVPLLRDRLRFDVRDLRHIQVRLIFAVEDLLRSMI